MALCPKCERALPANGSCLYCGKLEFEGNKRKGSTPLGLWIGYIAKIGAAVALCWFAYWLLFTNSGVAFRERMHAKLSGGGGGEDENASPWVKPLYKYPKVKELLANKLNTTIDETPLGGANDPWKMVTIIRRNGSELTQWAFRVNKETGDVLGENYEAKSIMLEK